jgi:hypothetical protein
MLTQASSHIFYRGTTQIAILSAFEQTYQLSARSTTEKDRTPVQGAAFGSDKTWFEPFVNCSESMAGFVGAIKCEAG